MRQYLQFKVWNDWGVLVSKICVLLMFINRSIIGGCETSSFEYTPCPYIYTIHVSIRFYSAWICDRTEQWDAILVLLAQIESKNLSIVGACETSSCQLWFQFLQLNTYLTMALLHSISYTWCLYHIHGVSYTILLTFNR